MENLETKVVTATQQFNNNSILKPISQSFLYTIFGGATGEKPLYTGETGNITKRPSAHICGHSHLGIPPCEWFKKYNLTSIKYYDITDIVREKAEVLYLEQLLIEYNDPILNQNNNRAFDFYLDEERLEELERVFYEKLINLNNYSNYNLNRNRTYMKSYM